MAMVSPAIDAFLESLSTLKFANRAKNIKNRAHINEDLDEKALLRLVYSLSHTYSTLSLWYISNNPVNSGNLVRRYEIELKRLRHELNQRSKNVVDKRKLIEVEEMRKRAEQDKLMALVTLITLMTHSDSPNNPQKRERKQVDSNNGLKSYMNIQHHTLN